MDALRTKASEIEQKSAELLKLFEMTKVDKIDPETGGPVYGMDDSMREEVRKRESELKTLNEQYQALQLVDIKERALQTLNDVRSPDYRYAPPTGGSAPLTLADYDRGVSEGKSLGQQVYDSIEFKQSAVNRGRFGVYLPDFDMKTLLSTGAGFAPPNPRGPRLVDYALRRPVVADLVPQDTTDSAVIYWMEETTFNNASATVSESGVKPESQLEYTERSANVTKIAAWIPVTEEQLQDVPGMQGLIEGRLRMMILLTEETQLLTGNGTSPNLRGFLNATGIQTQAMGADTAADAVFKAFTKVRWTGYAEPSGVVMHPNDWEPIRLLKTTTNEYIWGHPAVVGPDTLFGKPVIITNAITEGTALTGDFLLYSHISRKLGLRVDISDSHSDYFIYNKLAVRAEERLSLEIFRGAAFCKVTGI